MFLDFCQLLQKFCNTSQGELIKKCDALPIYMDMLWSQNLCLLVILVLNCLFAAYFMRHQPEQLVVLKWPNIQRKDILALQIVLAKESFIKSSGQYYAAWEGCGHREMLIDNCSDALRMP